ncbi:hypothetical protein IV203_004972 [Nitzschia inconspicua]|uniref:Uncharacterized protein n=1 Tax=Nitzschia inconspicua TaxID=303405 RepID=A0A9K3KLJ1_9STRA|nr:hypothetical protein IV203_004972 [Nitzschia inconspicua]
MLRSLTVAYRRFAKVAVSSSAPTWSSFIRNTTTTTTTRCHRKFMSKKTGGGSVTVENASVVDEAIQRSSRNTESDKPPAVINFVDRLLSKEEDKSIREPMISFIQRMAKNSTSFSNFREIIEFSADYKNQNMSDKEVDDFARAIMDECGNSYYTTRRQKVYIDYHITDTELTHDCDLVSFANHVETLATEYWNDVDSNKNPRYVAPYFCLVQSSGMGKTKLLYEYRKTYNDENVEAKVILVGNVLTGDDARNVYDLRFGPTVPSEDVRGSYSFVAARKKEAQRIFQRLDSMVDQHDDLWKNNSRFRVLLFDEAQLLLEEECGMNAFFFRCFRLWLRKRRQHKYVAVFTSTSCTLTTVDIASDKEIVSDEWSSSVSEDKHTYKPTGSTMFPHFVTLTTIGCQIQAKRAMTGSRNHTEYDDAIVHGRPLFSIMNDHGSLDVNLPYILRRMLFSAGDMDGRVKWESNLKAWLSILGTRVQMGNTSYAVVSDLVAKGYANLMHLSSDFAPFNFPSDPVCARLAMGMMIDGWKLDNMRGKNPSEWVAHLGEIYSSGLCIPEKGDFGEVMAALYFLLCGDILRHRSDENLKTFSVDLQHLFALLVNGGKIEEALIVPDSKRPRMEEEQKLSSRASVTLSCVQFCRNYLRSYEADWSSLKDQHFLRHLYASGTGFFTFAGCPLINAVVPLRIRKGESEKYIPCLLSIKSHKNFASGEPQELCDLMKVQAKDANLQALCVVVVLGSSPSVQWNDEPTLDSDTYSCLENGETVAAVVRVPADDIFGMSKMYQQLASDADLRDVYTSHPFIRGHTGTNSPALDPKIALRVSSFGSEKTRAGSLLETLSMQLKMFPPVEKDEGM